MNDDLFNSDSIDLDATRLGDPDDALESFSVAFSSEMHSQSDDLDWPEAGEYVRLDSRYELQDEIGHGAMGTVFRALHRTLKRPVAVKRMKKELIDDREFVRRFQTEARTIAAVNHQNIVQVYDFGWDEDGPYIVMEFVEGQNLATATAQSVPQDPSAAVDLTIQVCDALAKTHALGIIHRDVKPANILMTESGVPKLVDFGLARWDELPPGETRQRTAMGTPSFMPPEQWKDARGADCRSDLWSLAGTLYWMLTGEVPRIVHPEKIPEVLRSVLVKALDSDPQARYQSAAEFGEALQAKLTWMSQRRTAEESVPGQCPACRHRNDTSKKYCESCGAALLEPCLDCGRPVELWVRFCGECGNNVAAAWERRLNELETEKHEIESLKRSYRHAEAIRRAEELPQTDHTRLKKYSNWATETLKTLRVDLAGLEAERDQLLGEAERCCENYEYGDAERLLRRIPEPLRTGRSAELLEDARKNNAECWKLSSEVRAACASQSYEGLLPKLAKFCELKPNDSAARMLREKLEARKLSNTINAAVAERNFEGLLPKIERWVHLKPSDKGGQTLYKYLLRAGNHTFVNSIGEKLVRIPPGGFMMGSANTEDAKQDEMPRHRVEISGPLYMGCYVVTQAQYEEVLKRNPSYYSGIEGEYTRHPVEQVTWNDAVMFCRALSERPREKSAGRVYRLPTEAEWEFACRAGTDSLFHFGDTLSSAQANFDGNYPHAGAAKGPFRDRTKPVGSFDANPFGLFDMHGNVYEWCADWYAEDYYGKSPSQDPRGPFSGEERIVRGGGYCGSGSNCRSAERASFPPTHRSRYCGFRVVCVFDFTHPS